MAFHPVVYAGPSRSVITPNKSGSVLITKENIVVNASQGRSALATSSTVRSEIKGIATETVTVADALTTCAVSQIFENDTFLADTTNNSNAAHTNQRMILTDSATVNNTGTNDANGVVEQMAVVGDAADKKILVRFV